MKGLDYVSVPLEGEARGPLFLSPEKDTWAGKGSFPPHRKAFAVQGEGEGKERGTSTGAETRGVSASSSSCVSDPFPQAALILPRSPSSPGSCPRGSGWQGACRGGDPCQAASCP